MAGLSLFVVVGVVAALWVAERPGTYEAARPGRALAVADAVDTEGASRALGRLERAVRAGSTPLAAQVPSAGTGTSQVLAVAANAEALDVTGFSLRYVDETVPLSAAGSWIAAVEVTWRFAGVDRRLARTELRVGFDQADGTARITGLGGGSGAARTPVWLSGRVTVRRSRDTLVLAAPGIDVDRYEAQARRAVSVVGRVLPSWRGPLVVEIPASESALDRALGAGPGRYAAIAAVTSAIDGRAGRSPVHVFVNPEVDGRLRRKGAQVVMSHEAVHVATDAPGSGVPLWLLEGFADYVALRDVRLPTSTTAGQVITQVRSDGLPSSLPGEVEFDTGDAHLGAAYEAAWVACTVLADRGGEQALVDLYDRVDAGRSMEGALRVHFGWSETDLVTAWRARLADLAATTRG